MVEVLRNYDQLLAAAKSAPLSPGLIAQVETAMASRDMEFLYSQIPSAILETLEGVERVSKIVRAMKEFSHPGGKEKTPSNLNKAIETTTTVARNEWKYVADLELRLAPNLPPVPCFLGEFNQAVLNLIVNAAHAVGDAVRAHPGNKGKITVSTERLGEQVEIRVSDTGTGIEEKHRAKIFEPFFTTKGIGKGTGQGLTVVYSIIVKKHGGTVTFETEVGRGSTFIIRLPLNPPP
jgi:signal transduction histidine kinase